MRIHCLENVDKALQFLKDQRVHLENMGSHDIVDGSPRLSLGLIWTIILRFQVDKFKIRFLFFFSNLLSLYIGLYIRRSLSRSPIFPVHFNLLVTGSFFSSFFRFKILLLNKLKIKKPNLPRTLCSCGVKWRPQATITWTYAISPPRGEMGSLSTR